MGLARMAAPSKRVTTGSMVLTMLARLAPILPSPAKNVKMGNAVARTAIPAMTSHSVAVTGIEIVPVVEP